MGRKFFDTSFFIFCFLMIISCLGGLFLNLNANATNIIAILGLFWGVLAFLTFLWLTERLYYYKKRKGSKKNKKLPDKLLSSMQNNKIYNYGVKAVRAYNPTNFFILISGVLYGLSIIWSLFVPLEEEAIYSLQDSMDTFFLHENIAYKPSLQLNATLLIVENFIILLVLFCTYWLSQIFVYGSSKASPILFLALALFFISLFTLVPVMQLSNALTIPENINGYGWNNIDVLQKLGVIPLQPMSYFQLRLYAIGLPGVFFFYIPALLVGFTLVVNLFSKSLDKRKVFMGLVVLSILMFVDIYMVANLKQLSLWLSGWCILGIASIRSRSDIRKIYRIHQ